MATTFETQLMNMKEYKNLDGMQDVVFMVTFNRIGNRRVNGSPYGSNYSATIQLPPPSSEQFIPYNELTEPVVLSWIESVVDMKSVDEQIDADIDEQLHPTILDLPYPWLPTPSNI